VCHLHDTACRPETVADKAAANKTTTYSDLTGTHLFFPVAIETAGESGTQWTVELVQTDWTYDKDLVKCVIKKLSR